MIKMFRQVIIGILISNISYAGLPPTTVKGQTDVGAKVKFQFQAPHNQITDLGGVSGLIETGSTNILTNPGFEASVTNWTASGGATATANSTAKGTGALGYDWNSNGASQTLVSSTIVVPNGLQGNNGLVSCNIKTVSGTATYTLTVDDGTTNIVTPITINNSTNTFIQTSLNFVYPSSGSIRVKLSSVAADEPEIYIDDCFLGSAVNVASIPPQAVLMGTVKVSGCAAVWSTTSTSYASFAAQTGCSYAVTKNALSPTTNIPAIRFASLPAGDYLLQATGRIENNVGNQASWFQFYDGTTASIEESNITSSTSVIGVSPGISQSFSYSAPQSNVTLQIRAKVSAGGTANLYGLSAYPLVIKVWYFPPSSQQAVSSSNADYSGSTYSLTASNTQGIGTPTSASCTHDRVGGNLLLKCKLTTGTPTATEMRINLPNGLVSADTTRIPSIQLVGYGARNVINAAYNYNMLIEPSVGYLTVGAENPSLAGLTKQNGSALFLAGEVFSFFASVPIQGWSSSQRAPTLIGSVTSNSNGAERIERAQLTCSASSSITRQSGTWLSTVGNLSSGVCSYTLTSGAYSDLPTCTISGNNNVIISTAEWKVFPVTATTGSIVCTSGNAACTGGAAVNLICMGPR